MRTWLELVYPEADNARAAFVADVDRLRGELTWPEKPRAIDFAGVKHWLIDHGATQADLAEMLGTTRQNLHQALSGRRPNMGLRRELAALGVPTNLLGLEAQEGA